MRAVFWITLLVVFFSTQTALAGSEKQGPFYFMLYPTFLTNIQSNSGKKKVHYLQVRVEIVTDSFPAIEAVKYHEPQLQDALLKLFGAQEITYISKPDGREELQTQARVAVDNVLRSEGVADPVKQVLFTEYIVQ